MLDRSAIYQKSAKGAEAIATRSAALAPKQRSLLIFVDGKRTCEELMRMAQGLGDPEELMGHLVAGGFVEAMGGVKPASGTPAAPAPAASAPPATAPAAPRPAVTLAQAQRFASRRLTDLLGPEAESLCLRIEATRNAQEFQAAVARAEGMLRQFRSAQVADRFAADMQTQRPA